MRLGRAKEKSKTSSLPRSKPIARSSAPKKSTSSRQPGSSRWSKRIERLRAGLSDYPEAVLRTLDELHKRNIPAKPVAESVEVEGTGLAEATESALGMARYGVVVAEEHAATAIAVARDLRFPGPVYGGPVLNEGKVAGPLALRHGAPIWLEPWLQTIKLFENGSWHNNQGMWATPVEDRVLGESGRKAALERAKQELMTAREGLLAAKPCFHLQSPASRPPGRY